MHMRLPTTHSGWLPGLSCGHSPWKLNQEDVNGEKLTVKKWWIFGADFFTVWCRFFSRFTPIFHGL